MSDQRTIWVFPPDTDSWYQVDLPYGDEFADALKDNEPRAWRTLLSAVKRLIAAVPAD